jgi:hypothetical protein
MSVFEDKIQEFEGRPVGFTGSEQSHRLAMYQHFMAINKFEGLVPSADDERLFKLLAMGQISKKEYLDLCLTSINNLPK